MKDARRLNGDAGLRWRCAVLVAGPEGTILIGPMCGHARNGWALNCYTYSAG